MKTYHVYGIGNALVDQEFEVDDAVLAEHGLEKGSRKLVNSAEYNDLFFKINTRYEPRQTTGGGSVANSLVALSKLGGHAFFSCKISNDDMGEFYRNDLFEAGVDTNIETIRENGVTGRCMVLVTPDGERTMATHLGISEDISSNEIIDNCLLRSQYVYFESYLASSDIAIKSVERVKKMARGSNIKIAASLSDTNMIHTYRKEMKKCLEGGVDLLLCNKAEAALWTGSSSLKKISYRLRHQCESFVITLGSEGALVCDGRKVTKVPAPTATAVDTVGAGDAFAGAFLYGITHNFSYNDASILACTVAAKMVETFGPRLHDDRYFEIKRQFSLR